MFDQPSRYSPGRCDQMAALMDICLERSAPRKLCVKYSAVPKRGTCTCPIHYKMKKKSDIVLGGKIMNLFYFLKMKSKLQFFVFLSFPRLDMSYILTIPNWN